MADALAQVVRQLRKRYGPKPAGWQWGRVRKLRLQNPVFQNVPILKWIFNHGPVPCGGDADTTSQAAVNWLDPASETDNIAGMRLTIDVGNWSASRFVLAGGQSGNPLSPHFTDLFDLWQRGEGVPIPWTADDVRDAVRETLRLEPA
jgi:penicillin amidase